MIKKFAEKLVALVCLILLAPFCGCESVNASFWAFDKSTNGVFGTPKAPSQVDLFIAKKPPYDFEEVGIITFETFSDYNNEAAVYQIMRERAAKAGVDGIIILNTQEFSSASAFLHAYPHKRGYRGDYYDRRGPDDMYRYRASAIMKIKK